MYIHECLYSVFLCVDFGLNALMCILRAINLLQLLLTDKYIIFCCNWQSKMLVRYFTGNSMH